MSLQPNPDYSVICGLGESQTRGFVNPGGILFQQQHFSQAAKLKETGRWKPTLLTPGVLLGYFTLCVSEPVPKEDGGVLCQLV